MNINWQELIGLYILIAGFIIGLGAVTVIDLHGFLGRKSRYWTEATTRTHKVTKPMIWLGMSLTILGGILYYCAVGTSEIAKIHMLIAVVLILNGLFLSFKVSPFLLEQEKKGKADQLLPASLQRKITISFIISFLGWWSALAILVWQIVVHNI